jgi:Collagen triple helix repeat (20 copies).
MSTTVDLGKITASVTVGNTTTGAAGTNASVSNSGTTQDAVLNFTIPRGAQGVQGPQGIQGNTGPAGPTGPQGPMGDVAVITPEQQAAFTMYSVPGQNTDGPMTQKAVTDALGNIAASSVSYNNSQSGLASGNVQGAIDYMNSLTPSITDVLNTDLDISDEHGHILARFSEGEVKTKTSTLVRL